MSMRFLMWRGRPQPPAYFITTLIMSIIILGGYAGEYKIPLLLFLTFQLLFYLMKGAFLSGKNIRVKAMNSLGVVLPVMVLIQELGIYAFEMNWWLIILSVFGVLTGMAIMEGKEVKR